MAASRENLLVRLAHFGRGRVTGVVLLLCAFVRLAIVPLYIVASVGGTTVSAVAANESAEVQQTYNLPREDAATTLRQFAGISGRQVFFMMDKVQGEQTNAIAGEFPPREALDRMLTGTSLIAHQDEATGGFVVSRRSLSTPREEVEAPATPKPSNKMKHPKIVAWMLALFGLSGTQLHAQTPQRENASSEAAQTENVSKEKSEKEEVVTLSAFTVTASSNTGYGATMLNSSARTSERYIDIPQSVSVVTSELMKDVGVVETNKLLQWVPNVQTNRGNDTNQFEIRGFANSDIYIDGFQATTATAIPTEFTDRVEIVKGTSSTAFARGNPSGTVNLITKAPLFREETTTGVTISSGKDLVGTRFSLDNSGFVTADHSTAYRLVVFNGVGGETRPDFVRRDRGGLLEVEHRFNNQRGNLVVAAAELRNRLPGFGDNAGFSDPTWMKAFRVDLSKVPLLPEDGKQFHVKGSALYSELDQISATLNYKINDFMDMHQGVLYSSKPLWGIRSFTQPSTLFFAPDNTIMVKTQAQKLKRDMDGYQYQADFLAHFEFNPMRTQVSLLVGGDYYDYFSYLGIQSFFMPDPQPYLNYDNTIYPTFTQDVDANGWNSYDRNWSAYANLKLDILDGKFQVGISERRVWTDYVERVKATNEIDDRVKGHSPFLPMYSVRFQPVKWLSIYALDSEYRADVVTVDEYVVVAGPVPGTGRISKAPTVKNKEIGLKGSILNDKVQFSFTVFEMSSDGNLRSVPVDYPPYSNVTKKYFSDDTAKGVEFEAFGQPTNRLTLMLGVGTLNTKKNITAGNQIVNLPFPGSGDNLVGMVKYRFGPNPKQGLTVTAGGRVFFKGWSANVNAYPELGELPYPHDIFIANLGASYGFPDRKTRIALTVDNAFHAHTTPLTHIEYSAPGRQFLLTLERTW